MPVAVLAAFDESGTALSVEKAIQIQAHANTPGQPPCSSSPKGKQDKGSTMRLADYAGRPIERFTIIGMSRVMSIEMAQFEDFIFHSLHGTCPALVERFQLRTSTKPKN